VDKQQNVPPGRVLDGVVIDTRARVEHCRSCGAQIWWGRTKAGRACPFDIVDGRHTAITHFSSCPNARSHSKR
jgi:hypothetical protein